jgi:hypothetical protein
VDLQEDGVFPSYTTILGIELVEVAIAEAGVAQENELLNALRRMTAAERSLLLQRLRDRDLRCHKGPEDTDG